MVKNIIKTEKIDLEDKEINDEIVLCFMTPTFGITPLDI